MYLRYANCQRERYVERLGGVVTATRVGGREGGKALSVGIPVKL